MRLKTLPILLGTLFCVLTFALATSGFAHRFALAADAPADLYAAAYGLSAADICGGGDEDGAGKGCDACRLMTAFHVPGGAPGFARVFVAPVAVVAGVPAQRLSSLMGDAARSARAPPLA